MEIVELRAKIDRFSKRKNDNKETILLLNVVNNKTNEVIRDHIWIIIKNTYIKQLKELNCINKEITFTARLEKYFSADLIEKTKAKHIRNIKIN